MKRSIAFIFVVSAMTSCSSGPRHMAGQDFRRAYESGMVQTLDGYHYLGETNGAVYMLRTRVPLFGSKPKQKILFTETNALDPEFLRQMREESKVEPNAAGNSRPAGQ